ncbi:Uncharacterised protein [Mycobacteroides abscessus subsp. massiliense]|nr:Uncharacterised protein [Mycobacteroides abscessus subsp. massiliense]
MVDVINHFLSQRLLAQIILNRLVHAGKGAQFRIVIRIGQAAHIKHKVGIIGNAVFETKGFKNDQQTDTFNIEPLLNGITQLLCIHFGRIDTICDVSKLEEPLAFFLQAFHQSQVLTGQRVSTAGF